MLKKIRTLVKSQGHLVLATAGQAGPHASLMAYAASPDAAEFWLATLADTRKYRNLQADPRASLLVDDRGQAGGPGQALTVEAEARPFAHVRAEQAARQALAARHPQLVSFLALPGVAVLRLVALRWQLLTGLTEVQRLEAEKTLDAKGPTA